MDVAILSVRLAVCGTVNVYSCDQAVISKSETALPQAAANHRERDQEEQTKEAAQGKDLVLLTSNVHGCIALYSQVCCNATDVSAPLPARTDEGQFPSVVQIM